MKRREDGSESLVLCEESARANWIAAGYETVNHSNVLLRRYYELVQGGKHGLDVKDDPVIEHDGDELFGEPDWTFDELQSSLCDNVGLRAQSAPNVVKTAFAASGFGVLTDVREVLSLTRKGVQTVVKSRYIDAARVVASFKKDCAWRHDSFVGADGDEVLWHLTILWSFLAVHNAELQKVQCATEQL